MTATKFWKLESTWMRGTDFTDLSKVNPTLAVKKAKKLTDVHPRIIQSLRN